MPTPLQIEDALRRADPPASWGGATTAPAPPPPQPLAWSKGGRTPEEERARQRALIEALRRRDQVLK